MVAYDCDRADCAIETALALRSVERAVDEVLLPALEVIVGRSGAESAAWAFSARWAADWLHRATRQAPPPVSPISIVLGDASRDELDLDAPYIRALELFCVRAGVKVLASPREPSTGSAMPRPCTGPTSSSSLGDRWTMTPS